MAAEYRHSAKWVERQLDKVIVMPCDVHPQPIIAVSDATFWGRGYGVLVIRCPRLKKNIHYHEITTETPFEYLRARQQRRQRIHYRSSGN